MCATEQGLPSLLPVCESFAFKELIPQCVHTYCSCWVYSALTNFYIFFSEGNFRCFFCCCLGGGVGVVGLSAGLATLEAKVLYLFAW